MEPKEDKWITDVLGSLTNVQRAEPGPFLFAKIRDRLHTDPPKAYVSMRVVWGMAVSFVLLLALNWQVISRFVRPEVTKTTDLGTVVSAMQLYPANNQLYGLWSGPNY